MLPTFICEFELTGTALPCFLLQEQQQKQLELILAIAKSGKLWDTKRDENHGNKTPAASNSVVDGVHKLGKNQIQAVAGQKESNNDTMYWMFRAETGKGYDRLFFSGDPGTGRVFILSS